MKDKVYVWDRFVRFFHWALVLTFAISYLTGDESTTIHVYSGYFILSLIALRLVWGFVGSKHARFTDFVGPVSAAVVYLRGLVSGDSQQFLGHNPAGGWMVLGLLLSILCTGLSGLKVYGLEGYGPLAGTASISRGYDETVANTDPRESREDDHDSEAHEQSEELWEEIHEVFANLTVLLIIVHVAGVALSSIRHRENLVKAMISGYKNRE